MDALERMDLTDKAYEFTEAEKTLLRKLKQLADIAIADDQPHSILVSNLGQSMTLTLQRTSTASKDRIES